MSDDSRPRASKPPLSSLRKVPARERRSIAELIEAGAIEAGTRLRIPPRGRRDERWGTVLADGRIRPDHLAARPTRSVAEAAASAKGVYHDYGWTSWQILVDGEWQTLHDFERQFVLEREGEQLILDIGL